MSEISKPDTPPLSLHLHARNENSDPLQLSLRFQQAHSIKLFLSINETSLDLLYFTAE
jgi:hypothetical protein